MMLNEPQGPSMTGFCLTHEARRKSHSPPKTYDWNAQLREADRLGLGSRELVEIDSVGSEYDKGMGRFVKQT
jgi:hypothetical protein